MERSRPHRIHTGLVLGRLSRAVVKLGSAPRPFHDMKKHFEFFDVSIFDVPNFNRWLSTVLPVANLIATRKYIVPAS